MPEICLLFSTPGTKLLALQALPRFSILQRYINKNAAFRKPCLHWKIPDGMSLQAASLHQL